MWTASIGNELHAKLVNAWLLRQRTRGKAKRKGSYRREAFEAAQEGIDRVYPEFTSKKSLGAFIAKLATRAGIALWVKPFQNMRSSRATELIEIYPAHVVNAWLGRTEAVAMAHYRQMGKATEWGILVLNPIKMSLPNSLLIPLYFKAVQWIALKNKDSERCPKWRGQDSNLRP